MRERHLSSWKDLALFRPFSFKRGAHKPKILVIGVGGAGGNAVNNMFSGGLAGVDFCIMNTDAQAIAQSAARIRIQIGTALTRGLGAGARVDVGRAAAEETIEDIVTVLRRADMVFVTAGMGGGTGTGAAPVIARAAREHGVLTVGVVTKPFHFEGTHRMRQAEAGIIELRQSVDTLIVIPNQNLFQVSTDRTTFADAFRMADQVLHAGVRSISDLIVVPGLINLDFADISTVMRDMGWAMMGAGEGQGEARAVDAAAAAISNPLLDAGSMRGARGVLINISGGSDMTLFEVERAAERIRDEADPEANIIFGSAFDERLGGRMRVSIVATGLDDAHVSRREDAYRRIGAGVQDGERIRLIDDRTPEPNFAPVRIPARSGAGSYPRLPVEGAPSEPTFKTLRSGADDAAAGRGSAASRWGRLGSAGALTACLGGAVLYNHYVRESAIAATEPQAEIVIAGASDGTSHKALGLLSSESALALAMTDTADTEPQDRSNPSPVAPDATALPARAGAKVSRTPVSTQAEPEYQLQLGALPTEEAAWQEWNRLRRIHSDLLGRVRPIGTRVETTDEGSLWRVRLGPISGEAAEKICTELKRRHAPCLILVRRS